MAYGNCPFDSALSPSGNSPQSAIPKGAPDHYIGTEFVHSGQNK